MGQFDTRPESPDEWAGLPSEPLAHTHETDLEREVAAADPLTLALGDGLGSILIPVPPVFSDADQAAPSEPERTDDDEDVERES